MTEKRFTVHIKWYNYDKTEGEIELFDNGQPLLVSECIEDVRMVKGLLNELAEENQQLKNDCSILVQSNQDYRKENEQLKQVIKEVLKLLEEEVDIFSDKATEHDIQAYIELGELDNKDAYYMAVSTKKAIKLLKEVIE